MILVSNRADGRERHHDYLHQCAPLECRADDHIAHLTIFPSSNHIPTSVFPSNLPHLANMVATIPATFRAFQYAKHGAPEETLVLNTDIPQQTLTNTQVRIQIHSAAINPVDWKVLQNGGGWLGLTPPTEEEPYFIGFDGAGTVVEVGADVKTLKVGDAVYAMTPFAKFGSVSEYLTIEEEFVAPKPTILDFNDAASLPLAVLTSWQALVTYTNVQKGERVLILGGSGGTGTLAVQIAKALGAYVITTTSARNAGFVKSLGAHEVIDYTTQKWADVIDANSIDVVYDCGMEPASWNTDAQRVLKQNTGRFVTILPLSDRIESPIGATFQSILVKPSGADLRRITEYVEKKQIVPVVDSVHPFEQFVDAVLKLKTGRARGKIVIQIKNEQ